ncbi:MAG TPA: hypothetical protein V6D50_00110 [Chroococcales cyanobacterium]
MDATGNELVLAAGWGECFGFWGLLHQSRQSWNGISRLTLTKSHPPSPFNSSITSGVKEVLPALRALIQPCCYFFFSSEPVDLIRVPVRVL